MGPFEIPHITKQVQTKFEEGNNEDFFLNRLGTLVYKMSGCEFVIFNRPGVAGADFQTAL